MSVNFSHMVSIDGNTRLIRADAERAVVDLRGGCRGCDRVWRALTATLWRHALIEEVRCYVNPVSLGIGTPIFQEIDAVLRFRLLEARPFACGVVLLRYGTTVSSI